MDYLKTIAKAIVPLVIGVVLVGLSHFGVTAQMTVEQAITVFVSSVATSIGVWATPNA